MHASLFLLGSGAALLAACQATPPASLPGDDLTIAITPRIAASRHLAATILPYEAKDIDHLTLVLELAGTPVGAPRTLTKAVDAPLDGHAVTFAHLHKGLVYTVKARAYLADNTPISDDASSQATLSTVAGVDFQDAPTLAAGVPIKLVDQTYDGAYTNAAATAPALVVGDGGFATSAGHAVVVGATTTSWVAGAGSSGNDFNADPRLVQLRKATAITADAAGNVYLADGGNYRILKVDAGGSVSQVFPQGTPAFSLSNPADLALGPNGMLYVADDALHVIYQLDPATGVMQLVAGTPGVAGADDTSLLPLQTGLLNKPGHLVAAGTDPTHFKLYVSDVGNLKLRSVDVTFTLTIPHGALTTVVGDGTSGYADSDDGESPARLAAPAGLALEADGNILMLDEHRLRRYDVGADKLRTLAGAAGNPALADGALAAARFNFPGALAVGGGYVYVADARNHAIRRVDLTAGQVTTLAGTGDAGYHEGPPRAARFNQPNGLARAGNTLYILDSNNNRLRKL
ncbi:MAG: hypothetical protein JWM80_1202 [Cyanobacteria bacterium RYN_339]|nr:hypothetical protein [Cyanobacteria bacterium RYN_339]